MDSHVYLKLAHAQIAPSKLTHAQKTSSFGRHFVSREKENLCWKERLIIQKKLQPTTSPNQPSLSFLHLCLFNVVSSRLCLFRKILLYFTFSRIQCTRLFKLHDDYINFIGNTPLRCQLGVIDLFFDNTCQSN